MRIYIKPSANVIEMAVKERLSRTVNRRYRVKIGNNTYRNVDDVKTIIYSINGVSDTHLKQKEA